MENRQRITIKTTSGQLVKDMEIEELVEVDGEPYATPEDRADELTELKNMQIYQAGQIETILHLLMNKEPTNGSN